MPLPLLNIDACLLLAVYLPGLPSAPVPIDMRITEGDKTQSQVASIKALGIPTDSNDGPFEIPVANRRVYSVTIR